MSVRAVTNVIITCALGALAFGLYIGVRNEFLEMQDPSPKTLETRLFDACISRQKHSLEYKRFAAYQIDNYCGCYAETLVDLTTLEERRYFAMHETSPPGIDTKVQKASEGCALALDLQVPVWGNGAK